MVFKTHQLQSIRFKFDFRLKHLMKKIILLYIQAVHSIIETHPFKHKFSDFKALFQVICELNLSIPSQFLSRYRSSCMRCQKNRSRWSECRKRENSHNNDHLLHNSHPLRISKYGIYVCLALLNLLLSPYSLSSNFTGRI